MQCIPDGHVGSGDLGELHGPGETLVTLGIVVLEADLELDGLEEVSLFIIGGVVQQLLDITTDSGCNYWGKHRVSDPMPANLGGVSDEAYRL